MSDSLWPHGLQRANLLCPSLFPGVCSNSCWLSRWCHPTHLILCHLLLFLPSIFPSIRVFSNRVGSSHHQSVGTSSSVLPMNIQDWFPLGLTDLISLQSEGLSRVFSNTTVRKHQFFRAQASLWSESLIRTWPLEKSQLWLDGPLLAKLCLCCFLVLFLRRLSCFSEWQCQFTFQLTVHKHPLFYTFSPILDVSFWW